MTKHITVADFLTEDQIKLAQKLYRQSKTRSTTFAKIICEQITAPNILEINRKLGQENDAMYLAYLVEYALRATEK